MIILDNMRVHQYHQISKQKSHVQVLSDDNPNFTVLPQVSGLR